VDWSLLACGRSGHVTYAPAEADVARQLRAQAESGEAWRCLRCGTYVTGQPLMSGPAADAPPVRRGKEVRSALILRIFAVERWVRALAVGALSFIVWRFEYARESIEQAFNRERPELRNLFHQLGYNIDNSKLVGLFNRALTLSPSTIKLVAIGLACYAAIEVVEGTGLWVGRRWGEYFAMVATSIGLPFEIWDLVSKVSTIGAILLAINLFLVLYLVITKRLFGVRGGKRAYQTRLRRESIMGAAIAAAATGPPATDAFAAAAGRPAPGALTPPAKAGEPAPGPPPAGTAPLTPAPEPAGPAPVAPGPQPAGTAPLSPAPEPAGPAPLTPAPQPAGPAPVAPGAQPERPTSDAQPGSGTTDAWPESPDPTIQAGHAPPPRDGARPASTATDSARAAP
jgi:uncharacterized membrane protein (DUF2068 family)